MWVDSTALGLSPGQVGEAEVYLRNLIVNLGKIDLDNEYLVFVDRRNQSAFGADLPPNVRPMVIAPPPPSLLLRLWAPLLAVVSIASDCQSTGEEWRG